MSRVVQYHVVQHGQNATVDFQPPQVISAVEPSNPTNTVAGGTVILKMTVSSDDEIEDVGVLKEATGFTQQAIETLR